MPEIKKCAPPNYDSILAVLKPVGFSFFAYAPDIYSPSGVDVPEDIVFHERVHIERQGNDPAGWWARYLLDKAFRLEEELIAYAQQYNFVKKHAGVQAARACLFEIAQGLSESYALGMTVGQAESRVRNMAKSLNV